MAVPKRRTSKAKRNKRRAHRKLNMPGMATCPQCGETKLSHRACKHCGYYKKRQAITVDTKKRSAQ